MTTPKTAWPGREVRDPTLRAAAQSAVRQGWRYTNRTLFPPDGGEPVVLPESPQWHAARRALAALRDQGLQTVRPQYDAPPAAQQERPEAAAQQADVAGFMARLDRGAVRPSARGETWTLAAARQLVKDGYSVEHAVRVSGWGSMWFADLASD